MSKQIKDYYEFEVKTADQHLAGTDSNIFLILYGELDQSNEVRINKYIHGNAFERNKLDKFKIPLTALGDLGNDLGRIYRIELRSDCKYAGSAWRAEYIKIKRHLIDDQVSGEEKLANEQSRFIINEWINDKETRTYNIHLSWKNHLNYEIVYEDYLADPLYVPSCQSVHYEKTVTERTGFKISSIITKENTKSFSAKFGINSNFSSTQKAASSLEDVVAFQPFLELGFSHSFSVKEIDENIKEENKEISTTVSYNIVNDNEHPKHYEAIYKIRRINGLVLFDSIVGEFSLNDQIIFAGIRDVDSNEFIVKGEA